MKLFPRLAALAAATALLVAGCGGGTTGGGASSAPAGGETTATTTTTSGTQTTSGGGATTDYPTRDINMTVPFNPGGSTDLTGRIVGEAMGNDLGVKILVTNTPGAGGSVGTQTVLNAKNDGYTILADGMLAFTSMPVMDTLQTMPADWDFWLATFTPNIVAVPKDSPYQTLDDLVQAMKDKPGEVTIGTAGPGSAGHLAAELVTGAAGIDYRHVPYNGGNPAIVATLGGEVEVVTQLLVEMKDLLIAGDLRGLANLSGEEITLEGGVTIPSIGDALPDLKPKLPFGETTGLAVPKGLDEAVLERLDASFDAAMADQAFLDFCDEKGMQPVGINRDKSADYVAGLQSIVAWTLADAGVAVKSPEELNIPKP